MIYSFDKSDPARNRFLAVLRASEIDFELVVRDRSVVRVLGLLDPETAGKLREVYAGRSPAASARASGSDVYSAFRDRTDVEVIAGPCSIESEEQIETIVAHLQDRNIRFIRGGAYKPRTSPDSFQGLGEKGLKIISRYARAAGLKIVTEAMDKSQLDVLCRYADIVQVGSRNMFNYTLLTALGSVDQPILLKRGMAATIDEWLRAADYIHRGGNDRILLCERGIRTFEPRTRHTLDVAAIHLARQLTPYPVIADPSHAAGDNNLVAPLALASVAAGADGIMVEIHPDPDQALSDGQQALTFEQFDRLLGAIAGAPSGQPAARLDRHGGH